MYFGSLFIEECGFGLCIIAFGGKSEGDFGECKGDFGECKGDFGECKGDLGDNGGDFGEKIAKEFGGEFEGDLGK